MLRSCICGGAMNLELRTVIFARKVNIHNVPVHHCPECGRNDVFPGVKDDVGKLVGQLGAKPAPGIIPFDEVHEWAGVLSQTMSRSGKPHALEIAKATEERIDQLLDLLLIASSLEDETWKNEIHTRLSQLSAQYVSYR